MVRGIARRRRVLGAAVMSVCGTVVLAYAGTSAGAATAAPPVSASVEVSSPALASVDVGRRDVLFLSGDDLMHQYLLPGGSWRRPLNRGGTLTSQPAAVSWGPGRLDVFARGADDALWWRSLDAGTWSAWTSLGGTLRSAPTVASWRPGRLDVFVRGTSDRILQKTYVDGTWRSFRIVTGTTTTAPAATSWGSGRIDLVVRRADAKAYHKSYVSGVGWSSWRSLGGALTSQPALASPGAGLLDLAARGGGGRLALKRYVPGGWGSWTTLDDAVISSGPGITATGDDVSVAARRPSGFFYESRRTSPGGTWSSFRSIDLYRPFRYLGTWVDTLDYTSLDPATAVADMKARGVRTLYLSTARFNSVSDFFDEAEMGQFLDEAHAVGIKVVGWYVPAYGDMARDVRRTVAINTYVSPGGQRFDGIGVDIERYRNPGEPPTAGEVDHATFNARVVPHLQQVRAKTTAGLGAIVPSPYGTDVGRWTGFPWSGIGPNSDVVVPMLLWSFRGTPSTPWTPAQVYQWVKDQTLTAKSRTGLRAHVEGGVLGEGVTPVTDARVQAFVDAVNDAGAIGGSQYDYRTTSASFWPILAGLN